MSKQEVGQVVSGLLANNIEALFDSIEACESDKVLEAIQRHVGLRRRLLQLQQSVTVFESAAVEGDRLHPYFSNDEDDSCVAYAPTVELGRPDALPTKSLRRFRLGGG